MKASWAAPDGTTVIATFTGPLKTGKVTLTSEPQLPREEIVQLLLFGSASGTQAQTPGSGTQNSAIATAGGEAAQPLNHMLDQLGLGAVSAKVDTSQAANPKPEVEVQIARDLSLQIAVVLGQPRPGVNPDRTLVTLDWRFSSMWSSPPPSAMRGPRSSTFYGSADTRKRIRQPPGLSNAFVPGADCVLVHRRRVDIKGAARRCTSLRPSSASPTTTEVTFSWGPLGGPPSALRAEPPPARLRRSVVLRTTPRV